MKYFLDNTNLVHITSRRTRPYFVLLEALSDTELKRAQEVRDSNREHTQIGRMKWSLLEYRNLAYHVRYNYGADRFFLLIGMQKTKIFIYLVRVFLYCAGKTYLENI